MRRERHEGYSLWIGAPVPPGAAAMTLGRNILIRPHAVGDERLLRHELVHVRQFRELGTAGFFARYLSAYFRNRFNGFGHWDAYLRIPLEVEAEWIAQRTMLAQSARSARGGRSAERPAERPI